ncbi:response regulator [Nibricoccus aquaticus]|uniref:response regulator n=1 Tax=Nibricoccus aquaticus TaxID=2576891 RepID=UPI001586AE51|nr:response regulator [Nibricoccus aquaticus]
MKTKPAPSAKSPLILAVDDSKGLRSFVQKTLRPFACDVHEATNGFNAFFAIERARPDLILLDVNMPIMDGVETLRRIKSTTELQAIPVIMLPSPADHAVFDTLTALKADGLLVKPFNETALLEKIRTVLDLKPT